MVVVVANKEIGETKNAGKLTTISIAAGVIRCKAHRPMERICCFM
jgi:hypothetical protein